MPYHTGNKNSSKPKMNSSKPKMSMMNKKEMTLKEALEKFEMMKNKPEPMNAPRRMLKPLQKELMKSHADHHTKLHLDLMKKMMKMGYCFEQAHSLTMKIAGK